MPARYGTRGFESRSEPSRSLTAKPPFQAAGDASPVSPVADPGVIGDYAVVCEVDGVRRRMVVRDTTEVGARREVLEILGGQIIEVRPYNPEAVVRARLATGEDLRERGRIAARILQIGHDVAVMAAGTSPDLLQLKARQYLEEVRALQERRAWEGDLGAGRAVVQRLCQFHKQLLEAGHGSPGIRPVDLSSNEEVSYVDPTK
jgi:hypothetical protein